MTTQGHLIAIAIGPVQDFIAASRKTRDLWFGSMLLSEAARTAALALQQAGAELIFPAPAALGAANDKQPVPNKLLAILPAGSPSDVAGQAEQAAHAVLEDYVNQVKCKLGETELVNWRLVEAQTERFLEYYAAWTPYDPARYPDCRQRVERLLAGRKALRDFLPALDLNEFRARPQGPNGPLVVGTAKSSLDPSRDTVLQKDGLLLSAGRSAHQRRLNEHERRQLNLKGGEQLDGISLLKRHGETRRFVSTSRVAIDPFIRRLERDRPDELKRLRDLARALGDSDAVERFNVEPDKGLQHYAAFPFDTLLFYDVAGRDADLTDEEQAKAREFHEAAQRVRRALGVDELPTYLAVLAADGDRMGKAISERGTVVDHQALSERLATFTTEAGAIVRDHHGALIYSGGDDVLAFLPLDQALCCADRLRRRFDEVVNVGAPPEATTVSLSVGVAVGHYSEHLQNLLDWARRAERAAKDHGRNALAVAMHTRTAGPTGVTVVSSWDGDPVREHWLTWVEWHRREAIPDGAAYELREFARELRGIAPEEAYTARRFRRDGQPAAADDPEARSLLELEVERILRRKEPRGTRRLTDDEIERLLNTVENRLEGLDRLVNELIVARHFAEASNVAHGEWKEGQDECHDRAG